MNQEIQKLWDTIAKMQKNIELLKNNAIISSAAIPEMDYQEWITSIKISVPDLEYLFKEKYLKGILNIFKKNINKFTPLKSTKKPKYILYKYVESEWLEMSISDIENLRCQIMPKIAQTFLEWGTQHPEIVNNNKTNIYNKNMIQMAGGNSRISIINQKLYKELSKMLLK
tara:strand:+ start:2336 stop:2845 length:510 start_codon:yes stop_codon:yes gene_type:complete